MNWIDMVSSSETEFSYLNREIVQKRCLVFDNVTMPDNCGGLRCGIRFIQMDNNVIVLQCDPRPVYTGANAEIRAWCDNGSMSFRDFQDLSRFLRSFAAEAGNTPAQPRRTPAQPQRPPLRVDRDHLNANSPAAANPGYIAVSARDLEEELSKTIIGQQEAVAKISHLISVHLGQRRNTRPLSMLLWGTTGVGKTQLGKALPAALNTLTDDAHDFHLEVIDCTHLAEEHATARLTGSPPGYVGHEDRCIWDCVHDHPRTVFVFNELEKSHPKVMQVLMEAVDSGQQQASRIGPDGQRFYDLSKCLFFFTSNLDLSDSASRRRIGFQEADAPGSAISIPAGGRMLSSIIADNDAARSNLLKKGIYPPEVVARFTAFVRFLPLSGDNVMDLVIQKLSEAAYDKHMLCLTGVSPEIVQSLYDICAPMVPRMGVRIIPMVIDTYLGEALMDCSHRSAEYAAVSLEGTLEDPVFTAEPPAGA